MTEVMENLHADLHAFLLVFRKVNLFIGMKNISNTGCKNGRKTCVPYQCAFSGRPAVFEKRNSYNCCDKLTFLDPLLSSSDTK
jgi:hypothetical protein